MANINPHTATQSASDRLTAARAVKDDAIARELALVAILVRSGLWPAWVTEPRKVQQGFPYVLHVDTPAGRLTYRLADGEMDMFRDLDERPNDGLGGGAAEKLAILSHLAMDGWK